MSIYDCIFGPELYRIYEVPYRNYEPYTLERLTNRVIRMVNIGKSIAVYTWPYFAYNLFVSNANDLSSRSVSHLFRSYYVRFLIAMSSIYFSSYLLRGISRSINPTYKEFIRHFKLASIELRQNDSNLNVAKQTIDSRDLIRQKYDFQFEKWPVDFKWNEGELVKKRPAELLPVKEASHESINDGPMVQMVSSLMAHTIGRILLYPGSLKILQSVLDFNLITGRNFLVENYNAKRYKLLARDNNHVDTIFINRKSGNPDDKSQKGNTLVICCEGNAGFYEIGILTTLLNLPYSVIGWNHPGFGGSTGSPFPQNDINGMEAVINFAVTKLNFKLENIIIFAWSIGGFPAAWAASNFPEINGVILDASFDDVLPLARSRMMPFLAPIVDSTIRKYFNLNVSAYLNKYKGPVMLIRRMRDEIISLDPNQPLLSNRGNYLLIKLLEGRFPKLMAKEQVVDELKDYLHTEINYNFISKIPHEEVARTLSNYINEHEVNEYPIEIDAEDIGIEMAKHIILFMANEIMINFDTTHCTPLPPSLFKSPYDLFKKLKQSE